MIGASATQEWVAGVGSVIPHAGHFFLEHGVGVVDVLELMRVLWI